MSATTTSTPMSEVLQLQRASFHRDGPPSAAVRRDRIDRFTHAVVSNTDELVEAISADFGTRPAVTTLVTDIVTLAQEAEMLRASVGKWMKPTYPAGRIGGTLMRAAGIRDRKSTRLNSSHVAISYAVFCLKKKKRESSYKDGDAKHTRQ